MKEKKGYMEKTDMETQNEICIKSYYKNLILIKD